MIAGSYIVSGVLLAITGYLFTENVLSSTTQTISWSVIFFFASAGASFAYLTVSEIFALEIRALAIAFFYAIATGTAHVLRDGQRSLIVRSGPHLLSAGMR